MAEDQPWRRLSARGADAPEEVLVEGVPDWLVPTLAEWIVPLLSEPTFDYVGVVDGSKPSRALLQGVERALRVRLNWKHDEYSALSNAKDRLTEDEFGLDLIDYLLHSGIDPSQQSHTAHVLNLRTMLEEAGSAWTVGLTVDNKLELQQRVADEAAKAALSAAAAGRAGEHLRRAWSAAFGRNPNPSHAYSQAIKAVEAAGAPVISPKNEKATLGTMIADLRNKPEKWSVGLDTPPNFEAIGAFVGMLELLWKAQHDRHGTDRDEKPIDIGQPEAEAAVHLAVTCVLWLSRDVVKLA